jgi:spore germination cell wall hydrolase CwlJ-like protein
MYTNDELYCMAVAIYNEAGSDQCTDEARELVGFVVLNRVNDKRYPDTIRGVLEQPGQYENLGTKGVHFAERSKNPSEAKALERAWETARKVLSFRYEIPIPENVLFQANFKQGIGTYMQIDNMYFCYAEEVK